MDIEKNIKEIRARKGLMQKDVAEEMNMEKYNYNRLEKKGDKINIEQLKQIADILGVTLKELLFNEGNNEPSEIVLKQRIELKSEKLASLNIGILNHIKNINNYLPSKPLKNRYRGKLKAQ